jgi:YihY family inner membrane protein
MVSLTALIARLSGDALFVMLVLVILRTPYFYYEMNGSYGAVLLGMAVPMLLRMSRGWLFPGHDMRSLVYGVGSFIIPLLVVFFALSLFYRLAPRRPTRFAEVWAAALCATVLLRAGESLFVIYLKDFATLNAVYGAFGGIMALLLWIYLSGCVFIFGACLCAGRAEAL